MLTRSFFVCDFIKQPPSRVAHDSRKLCKELGLKYIDFDSFGLSDLKHISLAEDAPSTPIMVEYTKFVGKNEKSPTAWLTYLVVCSYEDYKVMLEYFGTRGFKARNVPF